MPMALKHEKSRKLLELAAFCLVPGAGLEPARLAAGDFESPESTNFTTRAGIREDLNYGTLLG